MRNLGSVRNRFWPPPPAKADIATAILTNVIKHLVLLLPPNKHAFTAKAVWADFLIGNQSHEWLPVAVSISWFSVDCREHASFRSQEEDGEFSEIAKPAAASQILRFAIGQVAYHVIKALPKYPLLHRLYRLHIVPLSPFVCKQCPTKCDSWAESAECSPAMFFQ